MPEFILKAGGGVMPPEAARDYAATWAAGQGGGIESRFYNFESDFRVADEIDRAACLEYMEGNRAQVVARPDDFEPDELAKLDSFVAALKAAPLEGDDSHKPPAGAPDFESLDEFTQGYIEALFFTDSAPSMDSEEWREMEADGEEIPEGSFPADMGVNDLAPEALARIVADCAEFQRDAADVLAEAYARDYSPEQAGRDFHFTRNGHGVGFWDREALEYPGRDEMQAESRIMGETHKADPNAWAAALKRRDELKAATIGERLSALARKAGSVDSYWGDDSKVYV